MSANNIIIIKELIDGSFVINEMDIDCGSPIYIGRAKTLKEARKKVKKYMANDLVGIEYGCILIRQNDYFLDHEKDL